MEEVADALDNLTADTSKKTTADDITSVANIIQDVVNIGSASLEVMLQEKACQKKNPNILNLPSNNSGFDRKYCKRNLCCFVKRRA